ncbi:MAG: Cell division protein CpoB [Opitutales bacterium]
MGWALLAGLLAACSRDPVEGVRETDEKQYQLGKKYLEQGREEDALNAFMRVIEARRGAPESHLEAGYIFLQELKNPVRAIYHFERYLHYKPDSPQSEQVRQLIETAQKLFAQQLPAAPYQGEVDRIDLMEMVETLKRENEKLRNELKDARRQLANGGEAGSSSPDRGSADDGAVREGQSNGVAEDAEDEPDPDDVPRAYTVQAGDSLSSISRKFYGTSSRWIDIYQANRDKLSSEDALRVGQEIRLP